MSWEMPGWTCPNIACRLFNGEMKSRLEQCRGCGFWRVAELSRTEMQERMTAMVNASLPRYVRAFHFRFGHPVVWTPAVPEDVQLRFRLSLIMEEFLELLTAAGLEVSVATRMELWGTIAKELKPDLPAMADAMADLDYVVEGTRAVCGIDGRPIMDAVQAANMMKEPVLKDGVPDPTQKPTKPIGWTPPDVKGRLRKQGWKG